MPQTLMEGIDEHSCLFYTIITVFILTVPRMLKTTGLLNSKKCIHYDGTRLRLL